MSDDPERLVWERHANIGGPASTLLAIHDQFRQVSRRLVHLSGDPSAARLFAPLAMTLHHHHHAEEAMLFPLVHRRTGVAPEGLVTDHQALTTAIATVERSFADGSDTSARMTAMARFDAILVAHLAREEALVIPVLLGMSPGEAWAWIYGHGG